MLIPFISGPGAAMRASQLHAVDDDPVVVETRGLGFGGDGPEVLAVLLGRITLAEVELNLLGVGRLDAKHHPQVRRNARILRPVHVRRWPDGGVRRLRLSLQAECRWKKCQK